MKLEYTPRNMRGIEALIIVKLFKMLEEGGWAPVQASDGDDMVPTPTWSAALETIDSADCSALQVSRDGCYAWVELILGNGVDVISDYSCRYQDFDELMERHAD